MRRFLIAGLLAVLNILTGIITLPYASKILKTTEFEFWIILINLQIFINLFEFGMGPNIARYFTYIANGASRIRLDHVPMNYRKNSFLSADFKRYMLLIYVCIFLISLFITLIISNAYLYSIVTQRSTSLEILVIWSCAAFFLCLNLFFGFSNAILIGLDRIEESNFSLILNRTVFIVTCVLALTLGADLWSLPIAIIFGVVISRLYSFFLVFSEIKEALFSLKYFLQKSKKIKYFHEIIMRNVGKLAVTQFSSFTIQRFTLFVSPIILGTAMSSQYMITINMFQVILAFSLIPINVNITKITRGHTIFTNGQLRDLFLKIYVTQILIFVISSILIITNYDLIMSYLGINAASFSWILGLATLTYFFELLHVTAASMISTFNRIPFAVSAVMSSIAIILLTIITFDVITAFGLLFIQFMVQLSYNNWFWPLYLIKLLGNNDG